MDDRRFSAGNTKVHHTLTSLLDSALMLKNVVRQFFRDKATTEAQFNVMLLLKHADHPMTQKELSERLLVDKSNLTGLVDRMEKANHLRRVKSEEDRRCYHLELTDQAEELLSELAGPYERLLKSVMNDFSDGELDSLVAMMNKLQKNLDDRCACSSCKHFYGEE